MNTTAARSTRSTSAAAGGAGLVSDEHRRMWGRLRQGPQDRITVGHQTDQALAHLDRTYRRQLEDIAAGDAPGLRARAIRVQLRDVEREQELRAALRESWLARDGGCDEYTVWIAAGGLPAVVAGGGLPLSYALAVDLDRTMFLAGAAHLLAWRDEQNRGSAIPGGPLLAPRENPTSNWHNESTTATGTDE